MTIREQLKDFDKNIVDMYIKYIDNIKVEKAKDGTLKNWWASKKDDDFYVDCFKKIEAAGLHFDGKHISIQNNGVSYDYVAYKNKMLLAYPESLLDVTLVYKGDEFQVDKKSGKVEYTHKIANPFGHKDADIIGGYMVVKNKRGEFFTSLSLEEIDKCRKVAKTDTIWKQWFSDMCLKTIIKKAVKLHFDDVFKEMEEEDNKNYDLEKANESQVDKPLEMFKTLVKGKENEKELIEKFENSDLETRRELYKSVKG